jgi:hypothetical protein
LVEGQKILVEFEILIFSTKTKTHFPKLQIIWFKAKEFLVEFEILIFSKKNKIPMAKLIAWWHVIKLLIVEKGFFQLMEILFCKNQE